MYLIYLRLDLAELLIPSKVNTVSMISVIPLELIDLGEQFESGPETIIC